MLCLYLQAPFAVFRTFAAGSFRPTAAFITPSAAYGLLLNVAGLDMRYEAQKEMTLIRQKMAGVRIALGALSLPLHQTAYQQLHNYPVGNEAGIKYLEGAKGSKYNISPVRRSFLSDIRAYLCFDGNAELEGQVRDGLLGLRPRSYGLPFLGDNNFLLDRLEPIQELQPAYWFVRLEPDAGVSLRNNVTRLTLTIDREDMSNTKSSLFVTTATMQSEIPARAWVEVQY